MHPIESPKIATQAVMTCAYEKISVKGIDITRDTRYVEHTLEEWSAKLDSQKMRRNFKDHFHYTQNQLKDVRGSAVQSYDTIMKIH